MVPGGVFFLTPNPRLRTPPSASPPWVSRAFHCPPGDGRSQARFKRTLRWSGDWLVFVGFRWLVLVWCCFLLAGFWFILVCFWLHFVGFAFSLLGFGVWCLFLWFGCFVLVTMVDFHHLNGGLEVTGFTPHQPSRGALPTQQNPQDLLELSWRRTNERRMETLSF